MAKGTQSKDNQKQGKNKGSKKQSQAAIIAGLHADLEALRKDQAAAIKDLETARTREHFLESRVQQLSTEVSTERSINNGMKQANEISLSNIQWQDDLLRVIKWLSLYYPGFKYFTVSIPKATVFEFGGLYVEFRKSQNSNRITVLSNGTTPIKLMKQIINFKGEMPRDIFLKFRTFAYAVTPEGYAEFSADHELKELYESKPRSTERGERLKQRCMDNADGLGKLLDSTFPEPEGLPQRIPGESFVRVVLGNLSDNANNSPTGEQARSEGDTKRSETARMTSRLLRSLDEMRADAQSRTAATEQDTGELQPVDTLQYISAVITDGVLTLANHLDRQLSDIFGAPKEAPDNTSASAQESPYE